MAPPSKKSCPVLTRCRYGATCRQRDNSRHRAQYSHPSDEASAGLASDKSDDENIPVCRYGVKCRQRDNSHHLAKYLHTADDASADPVSDKSDDEDKPACRHGAKCRQRDNSRHRAKYSHPAAAASANPVSDKSDDEDKPACRYGAKCRQRDNPHHQGKYSHAGDDASADPVSDKSDDEDKPACRHGAKCRQRDNPHHQGKYSHPAEAASADPVSDKSDDEDKPACRYGAKCRQRDNPHHQGKYSHAGDDASSPDRSGHGDLPPCRYGPKCYRTNREHLSAFSHPKPHASGRSSRSGGATKKSQDGATASSSRKSDAKISRKSGSAGDTGGTKGTKTKHDPSLVDTDEMDTDDEDVARQKENPAVNRGFSLLKGYTEMSEQEKRTVVRQAMEAKMGAERLLQDAREEIKQKQEQVKELQEKYNRGDLTLPGESEALSKTGPVLIPLRPQRAGRPGSPEDIHFRLAESQFYRLLAGDTVIDYHVTLVECVVNGVLKKRFHEAEDSLKKERGEDMAKPVLAFHGTSDDNIASICEKGFLAPGEKDFEHSTDTGYLGKGVYFSEYPAYAMDYIKGASRLLLCQVLLGKAYTCTGLKEGAPCQDGHDSHRSLDGKELVVFHSERILPCYVVHYQSALEQYTYSTADIRPEEEDPAEAVKKFKKAADLPPSKIFSGESFHLVGNFNASPSRDLTSLVTTHGGKLGDKYFTILLTSKDEFDKSPDEIKRAAKRGVPCAGVNFLLESVFNGKKHDVEDYSFNKDSQQ